MKEMRVEFLINDEHEVVKYKDTMAIIATHAGVETGMSIDGDLWLTTANQSMYISVNEGLRGNYIGCGEEYDNYWSVLVAHTAKAISISY